jgi:WD40 repeat protein
VRKAEATARGRTIDAPARQGPVSAVHYSPDGSKLVVAYGSGYLFLGDASGKKLREWQLEGPPAEGGVNGVRFTPDGRHLLIDNSNATAYILRLPL